MPARREKITFGRSDVKRISRVVRDAERGDRDLAPVSLPRAGGDDGTEVRLGSISATWTKGNTATVTQLKPDGSGFSPARTFTAKNWFADVTVSSGTKKVACASVGNQWILIAAECA
jgi:hypothetical protein